MSKFPIGFVPWNKQNIFKKCLVCGKGYRTVKYREKTTKYCSRKCKDYGISINSNTQKIFDLFKENKTIKEISTITGKTRGAIYSALNSRRYFIRKGESFATIKLKVTKN